jgi:serine/threonine protein phosphatase 1
MKDQPDGGLFWEFFDSIQPHSSGKRIICGHSPQKSGTPNNRGFAVCIDTGPIYGGWLTCLDTASNFYWQVTEKGAVRSGFLECSPR